MANSSSFSFSTASSKDAFLNLWRRLLAKLALTFAFLVDHSENLEEVIKLIHNGEPTHLPPTHRFREDYDEFYRFFAKVLDSSMKNWGIISSFHKLEDEVKRGVDYNRHLQKIRDGWCRAKDDVQKMMEWIMAYRDDVTKEKARIQARGPDHFVPPEIPSLLTILEEEIVICQQMMTSLGMRAQACQDALVDLDKLNAQRESILEGKHLAYHQVMEENRDIERHLVDYFLRFKSHLGLDE